MKYKQRVSTVQILGRYMKRLHSIWSKNSENTSLGTKCDYVYKRSFWTVKQYINKVSYFLFNTDSPSCSFKLRYSTTSRIGRALSGLSFSEHKSYYVLGRKHTLILHDGMHYQIWCLHFYKSARKIWHAYRKMGRNLNKQFSKDIQSSRQMYGKALDFISNPKSAN